MPLPGVSDFHNSFYSVTAFCPPCFLFCMIRYQSCKVLMPKNTFLVSFSEFHCVLYTCIIIWIIFTSLEALLCSTDQSLFVFSYCWYYDCHCHLTCLFLCFFRDCVWNFHLYYSYLCFFKVHLKIFAYPVVSKTLKKKIDMMLKWIKKMENNVANA